MSILVAVMVVGAIALVAGVVYAAHVAEKKRSEAFQRVAEEMGFEFLPKGDAAYLQAISTFQLFSQGRSKLLSNLMRGKTQDLEVAIFDYRYVTGSGKHSHTWNQTVIGFRFEGPPLPTFSLRPENFGDKIGAWLGFQDIDFESHAAFSKKYLLRGSDEAAIRGLFTAAVLDYYEGKSGLTTEGSGNALLFYRHAKRVKPEAITALMEDGFSALSLFRPPDARGA